MNATETKSLPISLIILAEYTSRSADNNDSRDMRQPLVSQKELGDGGEQDTSCRRQGYPGKEEVPPGRQVSHGWRVADLQSSLRPGTWLLQTASFWGASSASMSLRATAIGLRALSITIISTVSSLQHPTLTPALLPGLCHLGLGAPEKRRGWMPA